MKKLAAPLVFAFLVLLLAAWMGTRTNATERYISPLLADGSRYTFLYPQRMELQFSDGNSCFLQDGVQKPSMIAQVRALLLGRRNKIGMLSGIFFDEIRVQVATQKTAFSFYEREYHGPEQSIYEH